MDRPRHYPVPALEKGLDIMESLAAAPGPRSLAELAAGRRRSSSELFRMLNCLERRGYVTRDAGSGKYALSLRLLALAHAPDPTGRLLQAARGPMRAFARDCRESCHLSVLEGGQVVVIAQEESPERVRLAFMVAGRFEPVRTAAGRLLLALGDGGGGAARSDPAELARKLAGIRRTGVSAAVGETIAGVHDLAVPVGRPETGVSAALTVTWLHRRGVRAGKPRLLARLRAAAAEINAALGLSP